MPLIQAICSEHQVNIDKAFIWSFKHDVIYVILRSCFHQILSVCSSNHDRKRTFLGMQYSCLFCEGVFKKTLIQNADPINTPFNGMYCISASLEKKTYYAFTDQKALSREKITRNCLIQAIVRAQSIEPERAFIWRHLNVVIMWFCVQCHWEPESCVWLYFTFVKSHIFGRFGTSWKYKNISKRVWFER